MKQFDSTLLSVKDLNSDTKEFIFSSPSFEFKSGQFITILFERDGNKHRKQYSIVSASDEKIVVCVKYVEGGVGSEFLWNLKEGDTVRVMAPLGVFYVKDEHKKGNLCFIATGTGVAPFVCIVESLLKEKFPHNIVLLAGYRSHPLYHNTFLELAKHDNFSYHVALTQPPESWDGDTGRVQKLLGYIPEDAHFYLCGLWEMIHDVMEALKERGVSEKNIHFERYD